jgi:hypothetical protein
VVNVELIGFTHWRRFGWRSSAVPPSAGRLAGAWSFAMAEVMMRKLVYVCGWSCWSLWEVMSVDRVARKRELEEDVGLSRSSLVAASKLKTLRQIVGM